MGRRTTLMAGSVLMAAAGLVFASTRQWWLLVLAGTIGVISPSGHEVGPFLSIEQAALAQVATDRTRATLFAWYNLAGSMATAFGSLAGGTLVYVLRRASRTPAEAYQSVVLLYAALGVALALVFARLSRDSEASAAVGPRPPGMLAALSGCTIPATPSGSSRRSSPWTRLEAASSSRASPPIGSTCASGSNQERSG